MGGCSSAPARSQTFRRIPDNYECIQQLQAGLKKSGLESSELIVFVDFTKSNEWNGGVSFGGRSLHSLDAGVANPYQQVITIICRSLAAFDDDRIIPTYGFGDSQSKQSGVFSFLPDDQPVHEFPNILRAYDQIARNVNLSGGTNFAPAINKAIEIVIQSGYRYHIVMLIADGQLTPECTADTISAICRASNYPLSIIMVGVGDGPWEEMQKFDDELPQRRFDNFQFVNFTDLIKKARTMGYTEEKCETYFATNALMEIPDQYAIVKARYMGTYTASRKHAPVNVPVFNPPAARTGTTISPPNNYYSPPLGSPPVLGVPTPKVHPLPTIAREPFPDGYRNGRV